MGRGAAVTDDSGSKSGQGRVFTGEKDERGHSEVGLASTHLPPSSPWSTSRTPPLSPALGPLTTIQSGLTTYLPTYNKGLMLSDCPLRGEANG